MQGGNMREIKFRCWHEDNRHKGWIEFGVEGIPNEIANDIDYTLIYQYTGLKDKNDKEIYEGDILRVPIDSFDIDNIGQSHNIGKVIIYRGCWSIKYIDRDNAHRPDFDWDSLWGLVGDIEIIGNIYENPEAL